jgi:hypothetical protein
MDQRHLHPVESLHDLSDLNQDDQFLVGISFDPRRVMYQFMETESFLVDQVDLTFILDED